MKNTNEISLMQLLSLVEINLTEVSDYLWKCYGLNNPKYFDFTDKNGNDLGSFVADKTGFVFEITFSYKDKEYRWVHPEFYNKLSEEYKKHNTDMHIAYDDVKFVDLELVSDALDKLSKLYLGEKIDERVVVPLELTDEEWNTLSKLAHEKDITVNKMVEEILENLIKEKKNLINKKEVEKVNNIDNSMLGDHVKMLESILMHYDETFPDNEEKYNSKKYVLGLDFDMIKNNLKDNRLLKIFFNGLKCEVRNMENSLIKENYYMQELFEKVKVAYINTKFL